MNDRNDSNSQQGIEIAEKALSQGDYSNAAYYVALVLGNEPNNPTCLALLDRIIKTVPESCELISPEEKYFALVAVRAYILAEQGDLDRAMQLLLQVLRIDPNLDFLAWIVNWFENSDCLATVNPDLIMYLFQIILANCPGDAIEDTRLRGYIEKLFPQLIRVQKLEPDNEILIFVTAAIWRKLGNLDEAWAIASHGYLNHPCWYTAVALASVYRTKGDVSAAIASYQDALKYNPEDIDILLDIADTLFNDGQIEKGVNYYKQVIDRQANHSWALPHYLYCQYLLQNNNTWQQQLQEYVEKNPKNQKAAELAKNSRKSLTPYLDYLPELKEATINILRSTIQFYGESKVSELGICTSNLDVPSCRLAIDLYQTQKFGRKNSTISILEIPTPDPRSPRQSVEYLLWRYRGNDFYPAVSPPSSSVAEAIAGIATFPYHIYDWSIEARKIAANLNEDNIKDLLGVMVHPSLPPFNIEIWDWIHRLQVAAALTIAYLDEGWENSLRKKVLVSLVNGPMDWATEAAIIALTQIARECPEATDDILELFIILLDTIPEPGYCPYLYGLICCCLRFDRVKNGMRNYLEEYKQRCEIN
jgi:tetratricopeptide (TPR) repeat protein